MALIYIPGTITEFISPQKHSSNFGYHSILTMSNCIGANFTVSSLGYRSLCEQQINKLINDQSRLSSASVSARSPHICYLAQPQTAKFVIVFPSYLPVLTP